MPSGNAVMSLAVCLQFFRVAKIAKTILNRISYASNVSIRRALYFVQGNNFSGLLLTSKSIERDDPMFISLFTNVI